jgi:undecaprenyl pyrophosphate synthase
VPNLSGDSKIAQDERPIHHLAFVMDVVQSASIDDVENELKNSDLSSMLKVFYQHGAEHVSFFISVDPETDVAMQDQIKKNVSTHFNAIKEDHAIPLNLAIVVNYSGKRDVLAAVKRLADRPWSEQDSVEKGISDNLYFEGIPDPDLIIFLGGKNKLGDMPVWYGAYSELVFETKNWNEFLNQDCIRVLDDYTCRERRFGALQED